MKIGLDDIMKRRPCCTRSKVERLLSAYGGQISLRDAVDLPIPVPARIWVSSYCGLLSERHIHELACEVAERIFKHCDSRDLSVFADAVAAKWLWIEDRSIDEDLKSFSAQVREITKRTPKTSSLWAAGRATIRATLRLTPFAAASRAAMDSPQHAMLILDEIRKFS